MKRPLNFGKDGLFRVLCVSDFHAERDPGKRDPRLKKAIEIITREVHPDLLFILGDLTDEGDLWDDAALRSYLTDIMAPCEDSGIPWAHIPGNHDRESGLSPEVFAEFPLCLSERGDRSVSGYGTYVLPILDGNGQPLYFLWAFDTHTGLDAYAETMRLGIPYDLRHMPFGFERYDSVHADQVAWYYEKSCEAEQKYGRKIPGVMLLHAPVAEHALIAMNPTQTTVRGVFGEAVGAGTINAGLFAAAYERGDIRSIVSGHDHLNSHSGIYMGIELAEDGSLGFDGYGSADVRGGRLLTLSEDGSFSSEHILLRDCRGGADE